MNKKRHFYYKNMKSFQIHRMSIDDRIGSEYNLNNYKAIARFYTGQVLTFGRFYFIESEHAVKG